MRDDIINSSSVTPPLPAFLGTPPPLNIDDHGDTFTRMRKKCKSNLKRQLLLRDSASRIFLTVHLKSTAVAKEHQNEKAPLTLRPRLIL
jgi:hypothetical protein